LPRVLRGLVLLRLLLRRLVTRSLLPLPLPLPLVVLWQVAQLRVLAGQKERRSAS
jgi:hypothetical protein